MSGMMVMSEEEMKQLDVVREELKRGIAQHPGVPITMAMALWHIKQITPLKNQIANLQDELAKASVA